MTRGEIWMIDFGLPFGSGPGFLRPAIVVQCDTLNATNINTVLVIPLTTNLRLADFKGNLFIPKNDVGLPKDSVALGAQIMTVDKECVGNLYGKMTRVLMSALDDAIRYTLNV